MKMLLHFCVKICDIPKMDGGAMAYGADFGFLEYKY
jgi:hypothetical protein